MYGLKFPCCSERAKLAFVLSYDRERNGTSPRIFNFHESFSSVDMLSS